jgi:hypothetical protein
MTWKEPLAMSEMSRKLLEEETDGWLDIDSSDELSSDEGTALYLALHKLDYL